MRDDKYMNPNDKARWGYSGTLDEIKVAEQTVGETGGVEHARSEPEDEGARNNGGGADNPKPTTPATKPKK